MPIFPRQSRRITATATETNVVKVANAVMTAVGVTCLGVVVGVAIAGLVASDITSSGQVTMALASGNTYYVATDGNDANPGTTDQPWLTIQKAANMVIAGDTVIVRSGTYNERVDFNVWPSHGHTGTASAKIIFKAEPRRSVTMNGFITSAAQYLRIEGFNITSPLDFAAPRSGGIYVNSSNVEIVDNYFHDIPSVAIRSQRATPYYINLYIANNHIYQSRYGIDIAIDGVVVENNNIERLTCTSLNPDANYVTFLGSNQIYRHNYFHGTRYAEIIDANGTYSHVDGFQTYNNSTNQRATDITIEGNIIQGFHQGAIIQDNDSNLDPTIHDITVRNNVFIGRFSDGVDGGSWGVLAHGIPNINVLNNTFIDMTLYGVGLRTGIAGTPSSGTSWNNIFYGNAKVIPLYNQNSTASGGNNVLFNVTYGSAFPTDITRKDPLFVDVSNIVGADGLPFTADDGYRLQAGSPAIDAGATVAVSLDIMGTSRPQGSSYDIGAYEDALIAPQTAVTYSLQVTKTGSGSIASSPAGINCGADCGEDYASDTVVTLTATQDSGSEFGSWSGCDSTSGVTCTITMNAIKTVTAAFNPLNLLTVTKIGFGSGTITSNPTGVDCGADCAEYYQSGTVVILAATPATTSVLMGWTGCDSTAGTTCTVTMAGIKNISVTFSPKYTLSTAKAGTGSGTITSSPAGINCGSDCTEDYTPGTLITLTAVPAAGSAFVIWTGCDSATGPTCTISMNASKTVMANFNALSVLTVTKSGTGVTTIKSNPLGISCGTDCTQEYAQGTVVTLTASLVSGSTVSGWTGCDLTSGQTCVVTMNGPKNVTVTAADTKSPTVSVTSPSNNNKISGIKTITARASDNIGVVGVQFLVDGVAVGAEDTTASYSISWDSKTVANGSHVISARARDAAGNKTTSQKIKIFVRNP